jgi:hypothetical protein
MGKLFAAAVAPDGLTVVAGGQNGTLAVIDLDV